MVPDPMVAASAQAAKIEAQLRAQGSFDSQLRRVVAIAASHGIVLRRGEYAATSRSAGSGPARMQVGLSLSARYPQFRGFVEDVLRQCPAVSVDRFSLKRDKVEQARAEIQVSLSFWESVRSIEQTVPVVASMAGSQP
jgi:uracil phosphoribosyltransferase